MICNTLFRKDSPNTLCFSLNEQTEKFKFSQVERLLISLEGRLSSCIREWFWPHVLKEVLKEVIYESIGLLLASASIIQHTHTQQRQWSGNWKQAYFMDAFQSRTPESYCIMCLVLQKQRCLDVPLLDSDQMQVTRSMLFCLFRCLQGAGACGGL